MNYGSTLAMIDTSIVDNKNTISLTEVIRILTYQQFYDGRDIVFGRNKDVTIKIKSSGLVIHQLTQILLDKGSLDKLEQFQYKEYVDDVTAKIPYLNKQVILQHFDGKLEILQPVTEQNQIVAVTVLMAEILSQFRSPSFDEILVKIREGIRKFAQDTKNPEEIVDKMCGLNNPNISLLENLAFLKILAEIFHFKTVVRVCAIQITKHINLTLEDFRQRLYL
jgi:hypothetical protein